MQERTSGGQPFCGRRACAPSIVLTTLLLAIPTFTHAQQDGVASLIVDLRTGTTISAERPDIIARKVLPGSVMKIAALAAALETGAIGERAGILCTRTVTVDGHHLTCTHPDLHRPLTAAEALTYSCNVVVATVAARLPRASFDRALHDLGLPPSAPTASVRAASLGLEGQRATPLALIQAVAKVGSTSVPPPWKAATLATVRRGLHDAARIGTASALGGAGIDALAKTGTVGAGGVSQGLVVGVTPASNPTTGFALIASGAGGVDAAALVADRLRRLAGPDDGSSRVSLTAGRSDRSRESGVPPTVRIGIAQRDGRYVVKTVPLDDYVAGVIAGEAIPSSDSAAMDALAIAARTYVLANRGRHASDGFDLCDLTHCQVLRSATKASTASATRTAGMYLAEQGKPANVFYTAWCGGHTERPSAVWRGAADPAYLPARPDEACAGEPAWRSEIGARDLLRALHAGGFAGDTLRNLTVSARTASGRVAWAHLDGLVPPDISGENLRTLVGRTLGWQHLKSTLFDVVRTGSGFRFSGTGFGHGVGLCVAGAAQRAAHGATLEVILNTYYPGLELHRAADLPSTPKNVPVRIDLPVEEEPERAGLGRRVTLLLEEVRARLGAEPPDRLVLRFHPTVESYQRASGSAWFTAAATSGDTIDLLPLPELRRRGLLDSTLRHELAHLVTRRALEGAPRWMHEGVADWAARPAAPAAASGDPGATCPADPEFSAAASARALQRIYIRARACYERELRAGRSWKSGQRTR